MSYLILKKKNVPSTHVFKPALLELSCSSTHIDTEKQTNEKLKITNNV